MGSVPMLFVAFVLLFSTGTSQRLEQTNDSKIKADVESVASATALYIIDHSGNASSLGLSTQFKNLDVTNLNNEIGGMYIQTLPKHPTSGKAYVIKSNADSSITVCGILNTGEDYCVTR